MLRSTYAQSLIWFSYGYCKDALYPLLYWDVFSDNGFLCMLAFELYVLVPCILYLTCHISYTTTSCFGARTWFWGCKKQDDQTTFLLTTQILWGQSVLWICHWTCNAGWEIPIISNYLWGKQIQKDPMSSYLKLIHEAVWSCCFGKHRKEVLLRYATFQLLIGYHQGDLLKYQK